MERLNGIGVSPGVVVGRAVILTQRTEVMRFPIPPDRVEREVLAPAARARRITAAAAGHPRPPRAGPRQRAGGAVRRADPDARRPDAGRPRRRDHPHRTRQRRVGRASRLRRGLSALQVDGRSVSARARERRRRRRRPPAHEPAPRRARPARAAQPDRRPVDPDRRRAHRLGGRATGLVARAGLCHRRRQPHLSHRHPGALAEGAGHRRPA